MILRHDNQGILGDSTLKLLTLAVLLVLAAPAARATPGETLVVTGQHIAMRSGPSQRSKIVVHLDKGARIMELGRQGSWVRGLLYEAVGKEGWVASRYLHAEARQGGRTVTPPSGPNAKDSASQGGPNPVAPTETYEPTVVIGRIYCVDCALPRRRGRLKVLEPTAPVVVRVAPEGTVPPPTPIRRPPPSRATRPLRSDVPVWNGLPPENRRGNLPGTR